MQKIRFIRFRQGSLLVPVFVKCECTGDDQDVSSRAAAWQGTLAPLHRQPRAPPGHLLPLWSVAALFVNLAQADEDLGINTLHIGSDCYVLGSSLKVYDECHIWIHSEPSFGMKR